MLRMKTIPLLLLLLVPAPAGAWDLIYAKSVRVTLCWNQCGIIFPGYALFVNTGPNDIGADEFYAATFTITSSNPKFEMVVLAHDPGPAIAPFHPGEVVGNINPGTPSTTTNAVLLTKVEPGETFRNTVDLQFLPGWFARTRDRDRSEMLVHFQVRMIMGGEYADFEVTAQMLNGQTYVQFLEAGRVSSRPLATPADPTTWGRIESVYR